MATHAVTTPAERLLAAAQGVLDGRVKHVFVRTLGSVRLFNASKKLTYAGYDATQELCKGLVCRLREGHLEILAPCFPKFYNFGERPDLDARLMKLLATPEAVIQFPEKIDGTCIRFYVHPDTGAVTAATRGAPDGAPGDGDNMFADDRGMHYGETALAIARADHPSILDRAVLRRYTPVFELICPENRIITNYGTRRELVFLAAFDKEHGCRELTRSELEVFARTHALHLVRAYAVRSRNWDAARTELRAYWDGTDREGTAVTIEHDGEIVLRVKVKSAKHLAAMRALNQCTIDRTRALMDQWRSPPWEEFRALLIQEIPNLPEEAIPSFARYYRFCAEYDAHIQQEVDATVAAYEAFVAAHGDIAEQKSFALLVKHRPDAAHFFRLRQHGAEGRATARAAIAELFRKRTTLRQFTKLPDDDAAA